MAVHNEPLVGIIMGSDSDLAVMQPAASILDTLGVPWEMTIVSAHRTPERLCEYAKVAADRGLLVIIAGAGGAAHLPGMTAAMTDLPVIGVPVRSRTLDGLDSLLSIVQMPAGIPVAAVAIDGARNAGLLAARIIATGDPILRDHLQAYRMGLRDEVLAKAGHLESLGPDAYQSTDQPCTPSTTPSQLTKGSTPPVNEPAPKAAWPAPPPAHRASDPVPDSALDPVPDSTLDPVPDSALDPVPDSAPEPVPDSAPEPEMQALVDYQNMSMFDDLDAQLLDGDPELFMMELPDDRLPTAASDTRPSYPPDNVSETPPEDRLTDQLDLHVQDEQSLARRAAALRADWAGLSGGVGYKG